MVLFRVARTTCCPGCRRQQEAAPPRRLRRAFGSRRCLQRWCFFGWPGQLVVRVAEGNRRQPHPAACGVHLVAVAVSSDGAFSGGPDNLLSGLPKATGGSPTPPLAACIW